MRKVEHVLTVTIEHNGALAEAVVLPVDLNDLRREQDDFLAQTASDMYDRVIYMMRTNDISERGPMSLKLQMHDFQMTTSWDDHSLSMSRKLREAQLRDAIVETFNELMNVVESNAGKEYIEEFPDRYSAD